MNQEILSFTSMQADHRRWDHVHSTWRVDLEHWQREHESALSELTKLQEMIRQHGEALAAHAQAIEQHQQDLSNHDQAISEYEHLGTNERLQETLADAHRALSERHQTQRDAHQRIGKHHRTVMERLANVKAALEAAL
jgi:chromosome segregation ATPase